MSCTQKYHASCFDKRENHTCKMTYDICNTNKSTYDVIRQEYNKVAMLFCEKCFLNSEGKNMLPRSIYGYLENQL